MAYGQDFFLDLAAKGKDVWNAWRRDPGNKGGRVTFEGVDFSEAPRDKINFAEFEFGDHANFSRCKWRGGEWEEPQEDFVPGRACFAGAAFGYEARFPGANFGNQANFNRATFRHGANFAGAAFGNMASFPGANFGNQANFNRATFRHGANFADAAFGYMATFTGGAFGNGAVFVGAAFRNMASFTGATFGNGAIFVGAAFGGLASFSGSAFGIGASFAGADFGDEASFAGAAFGAELSFADTVFKGRVEFIGMSEEQWARDVASKLGMDEEARAALERRHRDSWNTTGSGLDRFLTISFSRARFDGVAVFSGRSFEKTANFTNARFYSPPDFEWCGGTARIDFTGAHIGFVRPGRLVHWTSDTKVPLRLRAFRKVAEDTKNHDLERDLYIEERKAERGVYLSQLLERHQLNKKLSDIAGQKNHVWLEWRLQRRARNAHWLGLLAKPDKIARLIAHIVWIVVMGVYWALADYGRSVARPAVWLISSGFFFYWCYTEVLAQLMAKAPDIEKYKQAVRMLALGNTVPFVGPLTIDADIKKFLFCQNNAASCLPPIPPEGFQFLVITQDLFSITCVFFIGLALRNYFKIK